MVDVFCLDLKSLRCNLVDRVSFYVDPKGRFTLGISIHYGNCGNCEVYHFDIEIGFGWVGFMVYLGGRLK